MKKQLNKKGLAAQRLYQEALREASKRRPDTNRVRDLLERSLKAGSPEAAYALATWHLHGKHLPQNRKKAVSLLREAADGGVKNAMYDLAVCYEKGAGAKRNPQRAFEHYVQAALHGDKQSVYEVGRCYYYGIGTPKLRALAWIWLDRAREVGVSEPRADGGPMAAKKVVGGKAAARSR